METVSKRSDIEPVFSEMQKFAQVAYWEWEFSSGKFFFSEYVKNLFNTGEAFRGSSPEALCPFIHPLDRDSFDAAVKKAYLDRQATDILEFRSRPPHEKRLQMRISLSAGKAIGLIRQVSTNPAPDVTGLESIIEKLRYQETLLKAIQEIAHIGSYEWDVESNTRVWSEEMYRIFEIPFGEKAYNEAIFARIHPDDREKVIRVFNGIFDEETYEIEFRLQTSSGFKHLVSKGRIRVGAQGNILGLIGMIQDITERKNTQESIQLQKEFVESLLDNSINGVLAFSRDLVVTSWNKVMEEISGVPREVIVGQNVLTQFPAYAGSEEARSIQKVLQGEKVLLDNRPYILGREGYFDANIVPLFRDKEVIGGLCIVHDVTGRVKLEEEKIRMKLNQQKEILNVILQTQEEERRRIAEALHNGVGQLLYAIRLNLKAEDEIKTPVNALLEEAIRETRSIAYELMPNILKDFGLKVAIDDICEKFTSSTFTLIGEFSGGSTRFDHSIETGVYRIIQELVNNIVKHSKATEAKIDVCLDSRNLRLCVTDNGKGFTMPEVAAKKGIGLQSIKNRVALLSGKISIESGYDDGTTITIDIPLT